MRWTNWILTVGLLCACSRGAQSNSPSGDEGRDYIARVELGLDVSAAQADDSTDKSELADPDGAPLFLAAGKRVVFLAPLRCREAAAAGEVTYEVQFERMRCASLMEAAASMGEAAGFTVADASLLAASTNPVASAREQGIDLLFALAPDSGAGPQPGSIIDAVHAYRRDPGAQRERIEAGEGAKQRCKHIASVLLNNDPKLYAQMLRVSMTVIDVESGAAFWEYSSSLREAESPELHNAWFEISTTVGRPEIEIPPDQRDVEAADRRDARRTGAAVGAGVALALLLQDPTALGLAGPYHPTREGDAARRSKFVEGAYPSPDATMCAPDSRVRTNLTHLMQPPPPQEEVKAALIERHGSLVAQEAADFAAEVERIRGTSEGGG